MAGIILKGRYKSAIRNANEPAEDFAIMHPVSLLSKL
jgi:hypothetical protein